MIKKLSISQGVLDYQCLCVLLYLFMQTSLVDTTLLGHEGVVSCILFISLFPLALLTLSEDRSFKVLVGGGGGGADTEQDW